MGLVELDLLVDLLVELVVQEALEQLVVQVRPGLLVVQGERVLQVVVVLSAELEELEQPEERVLLVLPPTTAG